MNYIISLSVLLIALFIRKIINYKKHKKSINYYMILTWTAVLIAELIYAVLITKIDISSGSLLVIIIFSISSIMVILIQKLKFKHNQTNKKIAVNKYINGFFLIFYLLAYLLLSYSILPVNLNLLIRRGINFHDSTVQANIAVYSYNLIFILLISYWLLKYMLIISYK